MIGRMLKEDDVIKNVQKKAEPMKMEHAGGKGKRRTAWQ